MVCFPYQKGRIHFLSQNGWDYAKLEEAGIVSPVLKLDCEYKIPTTFPEKISISVFVKGFKGVKLHLGYEMKNEEGRTVCSATSSHAFLDRDGKPVKMKEMYPLFYDTFVSLIKE